MRALTQDEKQKLENRRAFESQFIQERMPILKEFAEDLELNQPGMIVADPERYLPAIDLYMKDQEIERDDRSWAIRRIGYFVGELLAERLRGRWFLNENPESKTFLRYVVGDFQGIKNHGAMVDPFEIAKDYLTLPVGRSLTQLVKDVEAALLAA